MDSSQNAYNEDTSALVERLDCLEKALFRSGQSGLNGFQSWEKGQASQLTASSLVLNYRKRKITDAQHWAWPAVQRYRHWLELSQHFRAQQAATDADCHFHVHRRLHPLHLSLGTSTLCREMFPIYYVTLLLLVVQKLMVNGWVDGHRVDLWILSSCSCFDCWSIVFIIYQVKIPNICWLKQTAACFFSFISLQMVYFGNVKIIIFLMFTKKSLHFCYENCKCSRGVQVISKWQLLCTESRICN